MTTDSDTLFEKIDANDLAYVKQALAADKSLVAARDGYLGSTPLHFAAHRGFVEIVRELLAAGADVHAREKVSDTTPLFWAAEGGHRVIARAFVERGAELEVRDRWFGLTPLGWATVVHWAPQFWEDKPATAAFLSEVGARVDVFIALAQRDLAAVRELVRADRGVLSRRLGFLYEEMQPLAFAASRKLPEAVRLLLELGADPNARNAWGLTPLAIARKANEGAIADLLTHGGAIEELASAMYARDRGSPAYRASIERELAGGDSDSAARTVRTALLFAAVRDGLTDAVELLLKHGADANATIEHLIGERPSKTSPLHLAAQHGQTGAACALLAAGAAPSPGAEDGIPTPLHVAAVNGKRDVARALVDGGARLDARESSFGATPLGWAEHGGHAEIAELLRTAKT